MILLEEIKKQIESLNNLISSGIIDASEGEQKIYMIKEKAVLKLHTRAINTRSDGRYITKAVIGDDKVQLSAPTYEKLIAKLYDFYYGEQNATLESLYLKWIDFRRNETSATEKTIKEDGYMWNAYLKDEEITRKPIRKLLPKDYIAYFRKITKGRKLTRKRFNNLKSVMNGILYYAIENNIIQHNPLLDINYKQFGFKGENNDIVPYSEKERQQILDFLEENDLYDLAIKLAFHLTIRIGELKGLRFDDIQSDYIYVCRFVNDKHEIVDDIKGHASNGKRWLPFTSEAKRLIEKIRKLSPSDEYLFLEDVENKKFITTGTFNRHLRRCCEDLKIPYRSSHKIRFSVASICYDKGVSTPELQKMLGHTTQSMTQHYLRDVHYMSETCAKVSGILS